MSALGRPVLVSRYSRNYQLSGYLRRYTTQPLRFTTGASTLVSLMQAANYGELEGGLLEALGRLLAQNVRMYVHPMPAEAMRETLAGLPAGLATVEFPREGLVTAESLRFAPPIEHLFRYLLESGWLESVSLE